MIITDISVPRIHFEARIRKDEVVFTYQSELNKIDEKRVYKDRYICIMRDRWDCVSNEIEGYFREYGEKGCLRGIKYDGTHEYHLWDLHKVFPSVRFRDNEKEFNRAMQKYRD